MWGVATGTRIRPLDIFALLCKVAHPMTKTHPSVLFIALTLLPLACSNTAKPKANAKPVLMRVNVMCAAAVYRSR